MKNTKRFFAMAAALTLAACAAAPMTMNVSAAATENTVSFTGEVKDGVTHNYSAYKIFSGTVDGDNLTNISFAKTDGFDAFLAALKADTTIGSKFQSAGTVAEVANVLSGFSDKSADAKAFADFVATHATLLAAPVTGQGLLTLDSDGYYVIIETGATGGNDYARTSYILKQYDASEGAEIAVKSAAPTVDKQVYDNDDKATTGDNNGWGESADHAINETFQMKLIATIPADEDFAAYKAYKVAFHDTYNKGITFENIASVTVAGETVNAGEANTDYQLASNTTNRTLDITINDIVPAITAASKKLGTDEITVEVIYNVHLNEDAATVNASASDLSTSYDNVNGVYLEYSNNPNWNGSGTATPGEDTPGDDESTGETPKDYVWVFTYESNNNKVDDANKPLTGAKFQIKNGDTVIKLVDKGNGEYVVADQSLALSTSEGTSPKIVDTMVSTGTDAKFNIKGLDAGTYTLVETEAPQGYKVAADTVFHISATHSEGKTENNVDTELADVTLATGEGNSLNHTIVDSSSSKLPSTGGMGTTLFVLGGGCMAGLAGIYLISKKRAKDAE
ncbi:MAG: isopeptide-forming domain-containing fimbrial protein [Ruminococcus sp.]|nr:isopeptide-forming domain-containing fimbrial protein [Ruminococcus sp.]